MEQLVAEYGYWAVLAGTFFEGETVPVLAGFAAHEGLLRLDLVMLCAFIGSFAGDQLWFWIGRRYGRTWLAKHPKSAAAAERVGRLLDRWGDWFVLSFRFLYGLRAVSPVAIAMSSISPLRFAVLNMISAAVWAVAVGSLGFLFGQAIEGMMGQLKAWEHRILAAIAIAVALYVVHRVVKARIRRNGKAPPPSGGRVGVGESPLPASPRKGGEG
ncbi:MAG: DedA family protein [Magnetospirillum sp.]|nr:DedA family protein [Magnetospirillum sp.]